MSEKQINRLQTTTLQLPLPVRRPKAKSASKKLFNGRSIQAFDKSDETEEAKAESTMAADFLFQSFQFNVEKLARSAGNARLEKIRSLTGSPIPNAYVGELQERWQFPSDHLPIAMTLQNESESFNMASWNILSDEYFDWVTGNSQGLSRSMLTDENIPLQEDGFTERDLHIARNLYCMLFDSDRGGIKTDLISLQECSPSFVRYLQKMGPLFTRGQFDIIVADPTLSHSQEIIIYNKNRFEVEEVFVTKKSFPSAGKRDLLEVTLKSKESEKCYQIFNCHIPGDPNKPGALEFATQVTARAKSGATVIAMGDMNFEESTMRHAFKKASKAADFEDHFSLYDEYNTNISPYKFISKCIDHFIIWGDSQPDVRMHKPDEILPGLNDMVELLTPGYEKTTLFIPIIRNNL